MNSREALQNSGTQQSRFIIVGTPAHHTPLTKNERKAARLSYRNKIDNILIKPIGAVLEGKEGSETA